MALMRNTGRVVEWGSGEGDKAGLQSPKEQGKSWPRSLYAMMMLEPEGLRLVDCSRGQRGEKHAGEPVQMRERGPGGTVVGGGGLQLRQPVLHWEGGDRV